LPQQDILGQWSFRIAIDSHETEGVQFTLPSVKLQTHLTDDDRKVPHYQFLSACNCLQTYGFLGIGWSISGVLPWRKRLENTGLEYCEKAKEKVKFTLEQATKAQRGANVYF
jgi:hypothetical protein